MPRPKKKPPVLLEDIIWLFFEDELSDMLEHIDNFLDEHTRAVPEDTDILDKVQRAREIVDTAFRKQWTFEGNPPEDSEIKKRKGS